MCYITHVSLKYNKIHTLILINKGHKYCYDKACNNCKICNVNMYIYIYINTHTYACQSD